MKRPVSFFRSTSSWALPPAALSATLIIYLALCIALAYLMPIFPLLGVVGAILINLVVLFFVRSRFALPLYIVAAGPSVALSLASSGILSRLYIGNLLFILIIAIWLLCYLLPERKSGRRILRPGLLAPCIAIILIGVISIFYARLFPDPTVSYTFPHSSVSITIVNLSELSILIGLPMFLVVVPGLVRTVLDVKWIMGAYMAVGSLYALGTIFAAPLGLYSKEIILGIRRPEVFGSVSSGLGTLIVLFTCIAFGQALYAHTNIARLRWGLLALFFAVGVIMTIGRESWIELFLSMLLMVGLRTKSWAVLLILILPLGLLLIPGVADFFDPTKVYGADRLKIWQDAIAIWQRSPIMGVGAGNYQFFDVTYGTDIVGIAHNQYLQVLAEMGVQGLLCLFWLTAAVGLVAYKSFATSKSRLSKALSLAYTGYFVALIFGGLFTSTFIPSAAAGGGTGPFVEVSYRWLLFGLILSIPNWDQEAKQFELAATEGEKKEVSREPHKPVAILN